MSSILTNNGAMVALQTLKGINKSMAQTQNAISTGKEVATAKDNAAVWAISKVMESDVKGFKAIGASLALGESTVAVARNASEKITDLLQEMKKSIIAGQEKNVDRNKIQEGVDALREQIKSVVGAAQFNGLNLVKGSDDVEIMSSLDRSDDGTVNVSKITVARQDMSTDAGVYGTGTVLTANVTNPTTTVAQTGNTGTVTVAGTWASGNSITLNLAGSTLTFAGNYNGATTNDTLAANIRAAVNALGLEGITAGGTTNVVDITSTRAFETVALSTSATGGTAAVTGVTGGAIAQRAETMTFSAAAVVNEGDGYRVSLGGQNFTYIAGKGETMEDVAKALKIAIDGGDLEGVTTRVTQNATTNAWQLHIDNDSATSLTSSVVGAAGGTASGGMFGLDNLDVRENAASALDTIETLIQQSISAAASFGAVQNRIGIQSEFLSVMVDSLTSGIGAMVDANMEETSARLQALQVQQQLGVQSLSIANQAPQMLLSLFR